MAEKKCSASYTIRKKQNKTILRFLRTPFRIDKIGKDWDTNPAAKPLTNNLSTICPACQACWGKLA